MKLINNFIGLGYSALYAETLAFARLSGLSPEQFDNAIRPGHLSKGLYETFMKWTLEQNENAQKPAN